MINTEEMESLDTSTETTPDTTLEKKPNKTWLFILIGVVIFALLVTGIIFLSRAGGETTGQVRDIFIILMALESIVIGVALIVLVVQLASLINLLQNEIKPILRNTNDAVNTLKGTTTFLSDNLANPVIKLNSSFAGAKRLLDLVRFIKK